MKITPAQSQLITDALAATQKYIAARAVETNTHMGAVAAAIAEQPIADGLGKAITAALNHDYGTALLTAGTAVLGILGITGAIITPEKKRQAGEIGIFSAEIKSLTGK